MDLTRYHHHHHSETETRNLERETTTKPISMESSYDVQKLVLQRIQTLEPENASRIMGYILIQEHGERDMVRLACASDDVLQAYVSRAKAYFGLTNNPSAKTTNPLPISVPFPHTSPRILIPNNGGFHLNNSNRNSSPSSPIAAAFPRTSPRPISYASVLNGGKNISGNNEFSEDFFGGGRVHHRGGQDQLQFVDDAMANPIISPSGMSDSMIFPYGEETNAVSSPHPHPFHRRSCSVNDAAFLSNFVEEGGNGGFGWRPCMYYARGFCKNGNNCKFLHRDIGEATMEAGSPNTTLPAEFDEYFRLKALEQQQQRFSSLMGSGGHYPLQRNRYFNFLSDPQRNDFASLVMGGGANSSSRQIYLTFPAESTFKEEDVSVYFSMFGPVQDVRIPYQQKRMFGFVTFVYAETVKLILAKGNPHYVCDSRVLVKPYKEKGKILDKKQLHHQQLERGDYSASLSPSGMDRELYDLPIGPRMLLNSQEIAHRRKLEQAAEMQHAIELQGRRMADLQLMGSNNLHHNHPLFLQGLSEKSEDTNQDVSHELEDGREASKSPVDAGGGEKLSQQGTESSTSGVLSGDKYHHNDDSYLHESTEYFLPDNLFPSPTKFAAEHQSAFSHASAEANNDIPITNTASNSSPLSIASLSYSQMTRSH